MNGAMFAVIWAGGKMVHAGGMGTGALISFISYLMEILFSVMMFSMVFILFARAEAFGKCIVEVLDTRIDISDRPLLRSKEKGVLVRKGRIEFRNVDFKYGAESKAHNVLSRINLTIEPGESVAIVGGTGSGIGMVLQKNVLFSGTVRENLLWGDKNASEEEIAEAARNAQRTSFAGNYSAKCRPCRSSSLIRIPTANS